MRAIVVLAALLRAVAVGAASSAGGSGPACDPEADSCVLVPPPGAQAYHAAFPDFSGPEDKVTADRIDSFERAGGRPIAWAYFSNNWFRGRIRFPVADVEVTDAAGRVPSCG